MRFKIFIIIFDLVLIFLLFVRIYEIFFIVLGIEIAIILFFSFNARYNFFIPSISKNTSGLVFTFDDGPHPIYTPKILEILKKHDVKAVFFLIGKEVEKYPELVKQIHDERHIIGNHSYSHSKFIGFFSKKRLSLDFYKCNEIIEKITGEKCEIFRPPFGVTNPNYKILFPKFKHSISWSIRSYDTIYKSETNFLERIFKKIKENKIVLLHDTQAITSNTLEQIIMHCYQNGIKIDNLRLKIHE